VETASKSSTDSFEMIDPILDATTPLPPPRTPALTNTLTTPTNTAPTTYPDITSLIKRIQEVIQLAESATQPSKLSPNTPINTAFSTQLAELSAHMSKLTSNLSKISSELTPQVVPPDSISDSKFLVSWATKWIVRNPNWCDGMEEFDITDPPRGVDPCQLGAPLRSGVIVDNKTQIAMNVELVGRGLCCPVALET
jgi:hypothetical protein